MHRRGTKFQETLSFCQAHINRCNAHRKTSIAHRKYSIWIGLARDRRQISNIVNAFQTAKETSTCRRGVDVLFSCFRIPFRGLSEPSSLTFRLMKHSPINYRWIRNKNYVRIGWFMALPLLGIQMFIYYSKRGPINSHKLQFKSNHLTGKMLSSEHS